MTPSGIPSPLDFFGRLRWLDGSDLLSHMEDYRRELMQRALYTFRSDGTPLFNLVLAGRGKKNWKSTDLVLAAFYKLLMWPVSAQGNDGFILANDEGQAGDDLALAKKLVQANPELGAEVTVYTSEIRRKDDAGSLKILPAGDVAGMHGKTAMFVGLDEIHGYRNWNVLEALAPDPTRTDSLLWITSYDTIWSTPGVPLVDLKTAGKAGDDPRMLFSWYSGDYCTDRNFADLPPEQRANPSMPSWPEGPAYLEQQRRRLPTHKFRRLHLNLPGSIDGAFLDGEMVARAIVPGLRVLPPRHDRAYVGFVDMSGGSSDDATLGIAHADGERAVLDLVVSQDGGTPFDPGRAVQKFVRMLREYGLATVMGDAYAGETFRRSFAEHGIRYRVCARSKTEIYEAIEPRLNADEVELLDVPKLQEQLLTLIVRGARVDHPPGAHDDWANAAAGALVHVKTVRKTRPDYAQADEWAGGPLAHRAKEINIIRGRSADRSFGVRR